MISRPSDSEAFARVPCWVLETGVSDRGIRLYALLAAFCRKKDHCWPSVPTLAGRLRCDERSVQRALAELIAIGAVARSSMGSGRRHTEYLLPRHHGHPTPDRGDTPEATHRSGQPRQNPSSRGDTRVARSRSKERREVEVEAPPGFSSASAAGRRSNGGPRRGGLRRIDGSPVEGDDGLVEGDDGLLRDRGGYVVGRSR